MAVLAVFIFFVGCLARTVVEKQPDSLHQHQNAKMVRNIEQSGRSGDWLATRGYHATDHLVSNATGVPISHVKVYDKTTGHIIEAEGVGAHATPLEEFIDKSYRVIFIRPRWPNEENVHIAENNANALAGKAMISLVPSDLTIQTAKI